MSEKTRSIKTKDVTDEEAREYLLQISAHLNEIARLEDEKSESNKSFNAHIRSEQDKLEKLRIILNDGVVITVHNFMDKDTYQIVWKDEDGNEVERTPFDDDDWKLWENQCGPKQRLLFDNEEPTGEAERSKPNEGGMVEGEAEGIPDHSPFNEDGEEMEGS